MGFIAELAERAVKAVPGPDSARLWGEIFGGTNKEERRRGGAVEYDKDRGSYARSAVDVAAQRRLLEALRARAPGNWTDDRYEQSRHFVGVQYICIARAMALLSEAEFQVFHKDPHHQDGKRPVEPDHPLVKLLEKPNHEDSFGDLMSTWYQQENLTGSALTWMVPSKLPSFIEGKGTPMELYPIETALAIPQPVLNPQYPEGYYRIQPLYPYGPFSSYPTPSTAVGAAIPAQWMMKFKLKHPLLRYDGYSPMTAMRLHIDEIESIDRSRWYSMKRSVNPSAVINFDEVEGMQALPRDEIDRIHAEWEAEFQGDTNAGKLIVGMPGGKIEQWGNRPLDMDYPQGWDQLLSFIMAGFGMSKAAAFMVDSSSYSTLFATLKQLHLLTLTPFCGQVAAKLTRILAPFFGDDLVVEIRCRRIDDHELKDKQLSTAIQAKCITKAEVRRKLEELDLPPTEEDWADEIAGTEKQEQGMPGGMPGMPGMEAPGQPGAEGAPTEGMPGMESQAPAEGAEEPLVIPELPGEEDESEESRPTPGPLGEGSLGPRKSITDYYGKSIRRILQSKWSLNGKH